MKRGRKGQAPRVFVLVCGWCDKRHTQHVFYGQVSIKKLTNWTFDIDRGWLCTSCSLAVPALNKLVKASKDHDA